jgi:predicted esterase
MPSDAASFIHQYRPPTVSGAPVLLLLHGTGGNEHDLLPLADQLMPGAGVLSPRGKILERGALRFFRRLSEGVLDVEDLRFRAAELAAWVTAATAHYRLDAAHVVAVGFSNGANIASGMVLLCPGTLAGAALFRAMVPLVPEPLPVLPQTPVLVSNGRTDQLVSADETGRLVALLRASGADVTQVWQDTGHTFVPGDISDARAWLQRFKSRP